MRLIAAALAAALAAGCATQPAPDQRPAPVSKPAVNLSGYPLAFRQGYADGCASAKPNERRSRNDERYKSDANYAQGWHDGYDICQRQK